MKQEASIALATAGQPVPKSGQLLLQTEQGASRDAQPEQCQTPLAGTNTVPWPIARPLTALLHCIIW